MPSLIVAAAALLAAAQLPSGALAPRESEGPPAALNEEAQVRDLCDALARRPSGDADPADAAAAASAAREREALAAKAAARTYRVEIPSKAFALGRYRPGARELELDGDRPVRAAQDRLALDLDGIDDVAFSATPEQVAQWTREKAAGKLRLVVVFRPGERCAGNREARWWRLAGTPLSWQLVDDGAVVASADEAGLPVMAGAEGRQAAALAASRPHSALIEKLSLEDDGDGKARLEGVQGSLDKCAASAVRAGALVVIFGVQGGHVRDPQVIVDGVRDDSTSACVAQALSGAQLSGAGSSGRGTATLALQ